eukprot:Skav218989  [mRNA]  locus=scaffold169:142079:145076:+ [translate_table: standard]
MRRHGRAQLRRRSPSPEFRPSPRRRVVRRDSRSPVRSPPRRRRRRRVHRGHDFDSRDSFDSAPSQADFDSRSRTPPRRRGGYGNRGGSGVNAIPLGRYEPPSDPEAMGARIWILHSDAAKAATRSDQTSTRIQVSKEEDMLPETKERSVDISGRRQDQDAAVELIMEKVLYCREDGGEVIKDLRHSHDESKTDDRRRIITVLPEDVILPVTGSFSDFSGSFEGKNLVKVQQSLLDSTCVCKCLYQGSAGIGHGPFMSFQGLAFPMAGRKLAKSWEEKVRQ